jgi:hypothetical protein
MPVFLSTKNCFEKIMKLEEIVSAGTNRILVTQGRVPEMTQLSQYSD